MEDKVRVINLAKMTKVIDVKASVALVKYADGRVGYTQTDKVPHELMVEFRNAIERESSL